MTDSNPIEGSDVKTSEMEPETSQTDNIDVEVEENDLPKYISELDNLENEDNFSDYNPANMHSKDYSNDVSDYNSTTSTYENETVLNQLNTSENETVQSVPNQLNTSENEIDQPIDQPIDFSIIEEPIRFTNFVNNTGAYTIEPTSTGVNMTEPDQLRDSHTAMDESQNFIEKDIYEEINQPVVITETKATQQVIPKDSDVDSHETMNEPELIQKEIYERKIETIWPSKTNIYNNEVEDDDDDEEEEEEIEEAKMIKIQTKQQFRRRKPINQQLTELSSPSNNITSSNAHPNVKKYTLSYILKASTILILFALFFYSQIGKKPTFLRNFADTTHSMFKEIDIVELPDVNTLNDHTVMLRKVANTFDRSSVFKSHGGTIATGLRDLGDTIRDAGQLLRNMYSKGSSLHTSFGIEIEAMVQTVDRLDSHYVQGEYADYFKERLNKLAEKIKDFRQSVEKVHNSIIDAEKIKLDNEGNIEDGFREADKFSENEKYSAVISKARNDLIPVNDVFNQLNITADQLDKMRVMLKDYEDKLIDLSGELGDEGVKVTKSDLKYLQRAIGHSKSSHDKFNKFAQID